MARRRTGGRHISRIQRCRQKRKEEKEGLCKRTLRSSTRERRKEASQAILAYPHTRSMERLMAISVPSSFKRKLPGKISDDASPKRLKTVDEFVSRTRQSVLKNHGASEQFTEAFPKRVRNSSFLIPSTEGKEAFGVSRASRKLRAQHSASGKVTRLRVCESNNVSARSQRARTSRRRKCGKANLSTTELQLLDKAHVSVAGEKISKSSNMISKSSKKRRRRQVIVFPRKRKATKQERVLKTSSRTSAKNVRLPSKKNKLAKECEKGTIVEGKTEEEAEVKQESNAPGFVKIQQESNADAADTRSSQDLNPSERVERHDGWTREQDEALHNAFFLVKPGPNFWREIAKRVPGKASKDCFDRYYSAYPTPPLPSTRARRYSVDSPIKAMTGDMYAATSMSAVKPLKSSGKGIRPLLGAHRTVRQLLRKQQSADKGYEADVFAAVEVTESLPLPLPIVATSIDVTPRRDAGMPDTNRKRSKNFWRPPSALKPKHRFLESPAHHAQLQSPEVLKKESNPGRLDRYLDKLHLRHIWRDKHSPEKSKTYASVRDTRWLLKPCIEDAKAAVVATAREMIQNVVDRQFSAMETESMTLEEREDDLISLE